jgi:hypothetical protein
VKHSLPDHLAPAKRAPGLDATSLLTVYIVLLIAIPSKLVIGPLGGAGTPAQIIGLLGAFWYLWFRVQRHEHQDFGRQPVRTATLLFAAAVCASYVAAMIRPINQSEISTADLGLVGLIGWVGIIVVANDGIVSVERLFVLLRRVAAMGGALAALGIVQFFSGEPLTNYIDIPGLSVNTAFSGVAAREGFTRPAGTAVHPIEFGVVLVAILPIALACAMTMRDRPWIRRWFPVIAIGTAIPLSISRSAIVGAIVCLAVLLPAWPKSSRRWMYAAVVGMLVVFFTTIPGFLGTLTGLFTGIGSDTSAASRTGSYAIAWEFIQRSPVIGRGFSTFLPSYWILDNQYLGLVIETGIVGLLTWIGLLLTGFWSALWAGRRPTGDPRLRQTGHALAASIAAIAVCNALYDLLAFPMSAGILFLMLGLSGALLRLTRARSDMTEVSPISTGLR